MDLGLKDKVALITGAGSQIGMGKAIALTLAKEGCDVIVTDINLEGAQKTAAEIKSLGRKVMAIKADVTKTAEVNDMVKTALAEFGKIDILVNAAGAGTVPKPFVEKTEAEWDQDLNLNLRGVLICSRAVLPQMISRKSGKIINVSSIAARLTTPYASIYAAAKSGVVGFTRSLATEVITSGINVNCIAPGLTTTNFLSNMPPELLQRFINEMPSKRANTPQDIANMAVFLASDVSRNIVGQTIAVDGGTSMV